MSAKTLALISISEYDGGMKGRGFTLVELIIAIAVMAILLVLATLSFRNYQAAARDKEREADVLALQNYLESVYPREIRDGAGNIIKPAGGYPAYVSGASGAGKMNAAQFAAAFDEVGGAAKTGPLDKERLISAINGTFGVNPITNAGQLFAKKDDYENTKITGYPNGAYVYIAGVYGGVCDEIGAACRRYTIFYHLETKEPGKWQTLSSKRL